MNSGKSIPLMMDVRLTNRPERMLNGGFKNLPPDSWKPFGNGVRGCIGRPFAWQEVLLLVAMVRLPSCRIR
jgi:cytochrome P450